MKTLRKSKLLFHILLSSPNDPATFPLLSRYCTFIFSYFPTKVFEHIVFGCIFSQPRFAKLWSRIEPRRTCACGNAISRWGYCQGGPFLFGEEGDVFDWTFTGSIACLASEPSQAIRKVPSDCKWNRQGPSLHLGQWEKEWHPEVGKCAATRLPSYGWAIRWYKSLLGDERPAEPYTQLTFLRNIADEGPSVHDFQFRDRPAALSPHRLEVVFHRQRWNL